MNNYLNLGGTIRARTPSETMEWAKPHLKTLGITRLANVTGLDTIGIPTVLSIRPNAKHLAVSQGKGVTYELAKASAIMEAIETYHIENPPEPKIFGSFKKLSKTHNVIDPKIFNPGFFSLENIHEQEIAWIECQDISHSVYNACKGALQSAPTFIPYALISLDSSKMRIAHGQFAVSSNGLASGNSLEEAICHGLYEVIERDSLARFGELSEEELNQRAIKLETINDPILVDLVQKFQQAKISLRIWDITSELGIPAFHCAVQDTNELRGLTISTGSGAHLVKEIALARALTEVAQSRLTLICGSRDDIFPEKYFINAAEDRALIPEFNKPTCKNFADCVQPKMQNNFASNIADTIAALNKIGINKIFLFDHTKPEFGVPVVQVFIAGAHFNMRTN